MDKRVRPFGVAIIGLGRIGALLRSASGADMANYSTGVTACQDLELLFGVEPNEQRRASFVQRHRVEAWPAIPWSSSIPREPDLWIVCVPTSDLVQVSQRILAEFPRARLLVEKPLATSRQDIAACEGWESGRIRVGFTRAFLKSTKRMGEIVRSGRLGALCEVEGSYSRGFSNNCSHLLDLMGRTLGQVSVDSWRMDNGWCPPGDVSAQVQGKIFGSSSTTPAKFVLSDVDDPETTVASLTARFESGEILYRDQGARIEISSGTSAVEVIITDMGAAIGEVVNQLAAWVTGDVSLGCTLEEALVTSRLLAQVMES